ncbi:MAG TPA: MATE family efflux transporter [Rhodobiaceae bacterium]|nr:MAG: Multidrug resistance protein NorM [Rhodobiaceae bacterium UBA7378]HCQ81375.1 MATE family efflux transporter [Rhodobiaceae bacterium]|tara:strand:+ start:813 stop:2156 length:1344 start_codon:yes stop_codon:yes gene_type:complete
MRQLLRDMRELLSLAWPVVISRTGILTLSITDTVMVGHYASEHLAYVGIGMVPSNIFILVMIGLLMGTSVLVSNRYGAGKVEKTGEIWWLSLPWGILIGLLGFVLCAFGEPLLLLSGQTPELAEKGGRISFIAGLSLPLAAIHMTTGFFLEGIRNPRPGMVIMILANIINIGANYVLVFGLFGFPELGAEGSIWATFVVRLAQVFAILSYVWFFLDRAKYGVNRPVWGWRKGTELRRIGYASGVSMGVENAAFNALALFGGLLGTMVLAAHVITINVFALFFMMGLGFGVATSVSVGNAYGAGDMARVNRWAWVGLSLQTIIMLVGAVLLYVFASFAAGLFTTDEAVIKLAATMIGYVSIALIFDTGQSLLAMSLRARRDTWFPTLVHILSYIVIMIPLTWYASFELGRGALGLIDGIIFGTLTPFTLLALRYVYLNRQSAPEADIA